MRLLFVISHLGTGGAQTSLARLAGELARRHEVGLYSLDVHPPDRGLEKRLRASGVRVVRLPYPLSRSLQLANGLLSLWGRRVLASEGAHRLRLRRLIRRLEPDAVNAHLFNAVRVAAAAVRDLPVPLVVTDHGDWRDALETGIAAPSEVEATFDGADAVVHLSESDRALLAELVPLGDRVTRRIPHGAAGRREIREHLERGMRRAPGAEGEFRYVMVGRGVPGKGWAEFARAVERLSERAERRIRGFCVGEGELLGELEERSGAGGDSPVEFLGHRDDPMAVIERCDVGVLPSREESLPMAVAEYLACGKPVIATAVGGIPEMLEAEDGTAGFLLLAGSAGRVRVEDLVEAMASYLEDPDRYAAHARRAEQVAPRFSTEACAEAYESLFEALP